MQVTPIDYRGVSPYNLVVMERGGFQLPTSGSIDRLKERDGESCPVRCISSVRIITTTQLCGVHNSISSSSAVTVLKVIV